MSPCGDEVLIAFHCFVTHPCGIMDLPLSLGEGEGEENVTLSFWVVPYKSAFRGIIGVSFLEKLDVMSSKVYFKVTYYNNTKRLVVLNTDFKTSRHIRKVILKNLLTTSVSSEKGP